MNEETRRFSGPDLDALVRTPGGEILPAPLGLREAQRVRRFHRTLPGYRATPLASLDGLAARLGVARLFVKDESPASDSTPSRSWGAPTPSPEFSGRGWGSRRKT